MVLFQEDFPVDFGPDYDAALQVLVLDFLSRLERLLPVPDLQHVSTPASHRPPGLAAPEPEGSVPVDHHHHHT